MVQSRFFLSLDGMCLCFLPPPPTNRRLPSIWGGGAGGWSPKRLNCNLKFFSHDFIRSFSLILCLKFGVFVLKNVLTPLKTHQEKRVHERVMLEKKNWKGCIAKPLKSCLVTLDKKNLPVARSSAVGVVFIVNLPFFSPCKDPFRSSISDPECFNIDLVH